MVLGTDATSTTNTEGSCDAKLKSTQFNRVVRVEHVTVGCFEAKSWPQIFYTGNDFAHYEDRKACYSYLTSTALYSRDKPPS